MGKRLYRISGSAVSEAMPELRNKEADIVLKDNKTIHGNIISLGKEGLTIKNFIKGTLSISYKDISEIIYDKEAAW